MSGEGTSHGPIYITRGMKAMCECGTAPKGNYLNIVEDHGVIAGPEQQPVLNTNDHTIATVIGFGNCTSDANPKLRLQQSVVAGVSAGLTSVLLGGSPLSLVVGLTVGNSIGKVLTDIGLISCKCEPDTPQVWQNGDEEHILDGAPILTKDSFLSCRNGGTIYIMEEEDSPDNAQTIGEEGSTEVGEKVDIVDNRAQEALTEAIEKINKAIPSSEVSSGSDLGLPLGTQPDITAVNMLAMATMSTFPATIASRVMPALGLSNSPPATIQMTESQRKEELVQNKAISLPSEALDKQGLITDMSKLAAYQMFQQPVSISGGGAVAAYNAMKTISPHSAPAFADVIYGMEAYGAVQTPSGVFSPGISDFLVKQGCSVQYLLPGDATPTIPNSTINLSLENEMMNICMSNSGVDQASVSQFTLAVMMQ